jgi:hypothetical protein
MQGSFPLTESVYGFGLHGEIGRKVQWDRENYLLSPTGLRNGMWWQLHITSGCTSQSVLSSKNKPKLG